MTSLLILDRGQERRLAAADFPVALGGPGSAVTLEGAPGPLAWLGLEGGEVFVQPAPGAGVFCNGTRLQASHWLREGDSLRLAGTELEVFRRGGSLGLRIAASAPRDLTEPPVVLVPPPRAEAGDDVPAEDPLIRPVPFVARPLGAAPPPPPRSRAPLVALAGLVVLAGAALVLLSRLALVELRIEPAPETVALRGSWPTLRLGPRFLAVMGRYTLEAEKAGYRRLQAPIDVVRGAELAFSLALLPGRLSIDTPGLAGALVTLDGAAKGTTPLAAFEVEAGERVLSVSATGYQEHRATLVVEGGGVDQALSVTLVPLPPPPPGPPPPPRPGVLTLASDPAGARVSLDGAEQGSTPLELRLAPGRPHALRVSLPGHADAELRLTLAAGEKRDETLRLEPQLGEVRIVARPPDALLLIDGEPRGKADQTLRLVAVPHEIEVRREGYESARRTLVPRPGFPQTVSFALKSQQQLLEERMPRVTQSPEGHELRLVEGGRVKLGSPRREPGRRANEPLRDVELQRRFYVATREVSNAQYRRYLPQHSSGRVGDQSLDLDSQPVVRVSWQQAAAYCNWLSDREQLPPAYLERDGRLAPAVPLTTGYRLPTEAEWERVARYPGSGAALKYPWGGSLPVPPGAGNYADESARSLVALVIDGYDDGHKGSAPVDSFAANALGFFHLGDNVAEWAHDLYTLTPSLEGQLVRDPVGPPTGEYHVIRGASFLHAAVTQLRLSFRDYGKEARSDVGFRVARYAE